MRKKFLFTSLFVLLLIVIFAFSCKSKPQAEVSDTFMDLPENAAAVSDTTVTQVSPPDDETTGEQSIAPPAGDESKGDSPPDKAPIKK